MRKEHERWRLLVSGQEGRYIAALIEEPPSRRVLAYYDAEDRHEFDIPLPWTYTYFKFAHTVNGLQIWQSNVYFSNEQITRPFDQLVYAPYLPNVSSNGEICWGKRNFSPRVPDDLDLAISQTLIRFWERGFNYEIVPHGTPYFEAVRRQYKISTSDPLHKVMKKIAKLSTDEVCAVHPDARYGGGFLLPTAVWLPNYSFQTADVVQHSGTLNYWVPQYQ